MSTDTRIRWNVLSLAVGDSHVIHRMRSQMFHRAVIHTTCTLVLLATTRDWQRPKRPNAYLKLWHQTTRALYRHGHCM